MITKLKRTIIKTLIFMQVAGFSFGPTLLVAQPVYAETSKESVCEGVGFVTGENDCSAPEGSPSVSSIVKTVVNILSLLIGIAAVIMIMIGGFKYVTSSGDAGNTASAKNTILYALVGLVVAALAQVIVRFVLKNVK